ncbi:hypothetical protein NDU88_007136 [Pleurodeles waltl]|uniref:Uncharacterized protein n=1 Tax=Pleurodeles waltl TaxID=8319 RepID=A0AAV7N367_PLEWA|nr:hypothetical protein NDU88_007136 [Pleurodeles waltl]
MRAHHGGDRVQLHVRRPPQTQRETNQQEEEESLSGEILDGDQETDTETLHPLAVAINALEDDPVSAPLDSETVDNQIAP